MTRRLCVSFASAALLCVLAIALPLLPSEAIAQDAERASSSGLSVNELSTGTGLEERALTGKADTFSVSDGAVIAWLSVRNPGEEQTVSIVWTQDGTERLRYESSIGKSVRWRTWSKMTLTPRRLGSWTVEVLDGSGVSLAKSEFTVQ